MIAPSQHHGRYLAFFTASRDGIRASVSTESILEFFPDADVSEITTEMEEVSLEDPAQAQKWALAIAKSVANSSGHAERSVPQWNGSDWYFAFGGSEGRRWEDAVQFGFVSAGGGDWYSKTVKALPIGARLFVYMPKIGYVGVGIVESGAIPASEFEVDENGKSVSIFDIETSAKYGSRVNTDDQEYFVKIKWLKTFTRAEAYDELGFFGNQNSVCKPTVPRWRSTVEHLKDKFQIS